MITTAFETAAEAMASALGGNDYPFARIEHPISSANEAALKERAHATLDAISRIALG